MKFLRFWILGSRPQALDPPDLVGEGRPQALEPPDLVGEGLELSLKGRLVVL